MPKPVRNKWKYNNTKGKFSVKNRELLLNGSKCSDFDKHLETFWNSANKLDSIHFDIKNMLDSLEFEMTNKTKLTSFECLEEANEFIEKLNNNQLLLKSVLNSNISLNTYLL